MKTCHVVAALPLLLFLGIHPAQARAADSEPPPPPSKSPLTDKSGQSDHKPHRTQWVIREWGHHDRPQQLDVSLGLLYNGLNLAAWYAVPVVDDGLIESLNDSFDVEFGALFGFSQGDAWGDRYNYLGLALGAGVRWNFYLTQAWTTFATLKLGFNFGFNGYAPSLFYPGLSVGGLWRFARLAQLRLELGYPYGLSLGVSFDL